MRLSEYFIYVNMKEHPLPSEIPFYFSHLRIDESMQKLRRQFRKKLKQRVK